jgi:hypothetical protein
MDKIIVVNSYTNTKEKEDILYHALLQLRKTTYKILIVSNTKVTERILDLCDYFLYDKEDILLPIEQSPIKWFATNTESVHLYSRGPGYSIIKNLKNALLFSNNLGFKKFISMEYDNIIHDVDLSLLENIFNTLDNKNAFVCEFNQYGLAYETRIFGGRVDFFTNVLKLPNTYKDWSTTEPFCSQRETLEYIFPVLLAPHRASLEKFNGYNRDYFPNSKIDVVSSTKEISLVYNIDLPTTPLLFIIGAGTDYTITVNNNIVFNGHLTSGQQYKHYVSITQENTSIIVSRRGETKKFDINIDNIESYKLQGIRFSLV